MPHPLVSLIVSSARLAHRVVLLACLLALSAHRFAPASYRLAPRLIDKQGGEGTQSTAGVSTGGLLACPGAVCPGTGGGVVGGGWRAMSAAVADSGRRGLFACVWRASSGGVGTAACLSCDGERSAAAVMASPSGRAWVGRGLLACPGAAMWEGRLCRFFSSHRLIQSATVPGSSNHPIDGEGLLFIFARPPPVRSSRSACRGLFPRPRPGEVRAWGMACGGGGCACLRSSSPVPLSRSRSFACCYMSPCRRFALFYPGRCVAIYGLFLPLSCRRWRFPIHALKSHPVASHGHFRRCCPLTFLVSFRRLVLASLPCFSPLPGCGVMAWVRAFSCGELVKTARVRSFVPGVVSRFSCHVAGVSAA